MSVNDLIFNSSMSGLDDTLDSGSDSGVLSVVDAASVVGNTAIVSSDVAQSIATDARDAVRHYGDNENEQGDDSEEDDDEDDDELDDSLQNILRLAGVETRGQPDPTTRTDAGQKRPPVKPASTATSTATAKTGAKTPAKELKKAAPTATFKG